MNVENSLVDLINYIKDLAPEIWRVTLKQQLINGWANIFITVILIVGLILCLSIAKKALKERNKEYYDPDSDMAILLIVCMCAIIGLILTVFIPVTLVEGIKYLSNPEYYAIQSILQYIK